MHIAKANTSNLLPTLKKKFQEKNINNQLNKNKGTKAMRQLALPSVSGLQSRLTRALQSSVCVWNPKINLQSIQKQYMFVFVALIAMFLKNLTRSFIWFEFNSLPYILYSGSFPLATSSIISLMYKFEHTFLSSLCIKIVKILISPANIFQ